MEITSQALDLFLTQTTFTICVIQTGCESDHIGMYFLTCANFIDEVRDLELLWLDALELSFSYSFRVILRNVL